MTSAPSTLTAPARAPSRFSELGVPSALVAALARQSIDEPFPIQEATLVDSLAGKNILGRGVTGSGKTLAFAIPTVANIAARRAKTQAGQPRALILVPTRELATQVAAVIAPLAAAVSLRCTTVFGGVSQTRQVNALRSGVDIVIACPGRLEDLINQRACSLRRVEITVLDEADHMADLGFLPAVRRLLDATPADGQRLLFSATLDNAVDALVSRYITSPTVHSVEPEHDAHETMTHHVLAVAAADKAGVIREIAGHADRVLFFTRTKHGARKLARQLNVAGVRSQELHGNLSQNARQRNLEDFSSGRATVLVATDVAARGIHVDDIQLVVHVDPPVDHKAYIHRSGRTARAGAAGVVATLMLPEQADDVRRMAKTAGITPTTTRVSLGHPLLAALSDGTVTAAPAGHGSTGERRSAGDERTARAPDPRATAARRRNRPRHRGRAGAPRSN